MPVVRMRAEFILGDSLLWHALNGPMFRGALGTALRSIHGRRGLYELMFDDGSPGGSVRPYRIRAPHTEPRTLPKGAIVPFEIDLFGAAAEQAHDLLPAFVVMAHLGLGERRVNCTLHALAQSLPDGSLKLSARALKDLPRLRKYPLRSYLPDVSAGVRFVGPVRLQSRGPAREPEMVELLAAGAIRLEALSGQEVEFDSREIGAKWSRVHVIAEHRLSRREGAQSVSGVIGDLVPDSLIRPSELRFLSAICVTGVGRHTAMGLGDCIPLPR